MELATIRYCIDQGDVYGVNWDKVIREDDGVHQAVSFTSIVQSVIREATVAVNVMERGSMKRWYDTTKAFKINNRVTEALKYLLEDIDEVRFNHMAFKAAMHIKDNQLIIWRTIKMKEHEFSGTKNIEKWVISSCHLLYDPEEWASTIGFFQVKRKK